MKTNPNQYSFVRPRGVLSQRVGSLSRIRRLGLATVGVLTWIALAAFPARAQHIQSQPTRLTVQVGAGGQVTNTINVQLDTNEMWTLTVDISGATGVSSAVLKRTSFTAPANDTLNTNTDLVVTYTGDVPQTGANDIAILVSGDYTYRLPIPIHSAYIWDGTTNDNAWSGNWLPSDPGPSDNVVFTSAGASPAFDDEETSPGFFTNIVTNVVISSDETVSGLRFSHGDETGTPDPDSSYRVEIEPGATLSVTGEGGFTLLRDTINNYERMWVEFFGGGSLVVSNSAADWSMLGESSSANDNVLDMGGLKFFMADVNRVGLGSYELYPNFFTNGYTTEPDRWVPNVTLAETNFIRTAWIGGEAVITNLEERPYAFALGKMATSGLSSSQRNSLVLGRYNEFDVESMVISGGSAKGENGNMFFNTDTNVIPTNVVPVAVFRGPKGGTDRMSVLAIADASGLGQNGSSSKGDIDLTDGKGDALIDRLYVGRDRWKSTDNASGQGALSIGGDNAAGTIFDVNTAYISAQTTGNNASDPADDDDPSGEVNGTVNVDANALFQVNGTLHLGYTTADAGDKRAADTGGGTLNVNGGTVTASNIFVGGITKVSDNNRISITRGGELSVATEIGEPDKYLNQLTMNDSTLALRVDGSKSTPYVYADDVITGGLGNTIRLDSVINVTSYPTQLPLIAYNAASPNFGVELPSGLYGYIVNNTASNTIDVVILDTPPANLVWNGSPGTAWNTTDANWQGSATFANGDVATFDDTAASASVTVPDTVFVGGKGVLVTNNSKPYSIGGAGMIGGTAPMNKWGTGSLAINVNSGLPLNIHEGSVTGSGAIGSTSVGTNATLSFGGSIVRLVSSGDTTLSSGATVANGADINGGTTVNSGTITGAVEVADADLTIASGGVMVAPTPMTSTIHTNTTVTLNGVWNNGVVQGPNGEYRINVFGTLKGTGEIHTGIQQLTHGDGAPAYWSLLTIGADGVLSPGLTPGQISVFTNQAQINFTPGSTIIIDVDMDSANGSNPKGNTATGSENAKNSDVIFTSRWSTRTGTLKINNVGSSPFAPGTVLKILSKPYEDYGVDAYKNRPFVGTETQEPVMDPPSPGLGMVWDLTDFATNGVIRINATATNPTNLVWTPTDGTNMTFSWPSDHIGWELLSQTRALTNGLSMARSNWNVVVGSTLTNEITITNWLGDPEDRDEGARFYMLAHPEIE